MPRYFMQDTPLASLEREMMTLPRYGPRTDQPVLPPAQVTVEVEQCGKKGAMIWTTQCVRKTEGDV